MLKVLFLGQHGEKLSKDHYMIDPLTSGSVLIRENGKNILIDSGAYFHHETLLKALNDEGLKPEDIDYVLNTHYHLDHTTNNFLFPNAMCGVGQNLVSHKTGVCFIYHSSAYNDKKNPRFPSGIIDLPTPGHSVPHHSYIYRDCGKTYVMAGDAISEKRFKEGRLQGDNVNDLYESAIKIFEIADIIIPGHGQVIEGNLLKELHDILKSLKSET